MVIKIPAGGGQVAKLLFYYNHDTLFNDVAMQSSLMAKNLATKDGLSLTEEYALTEDERDAFAVCVTGCLPDIYDKMVKITKFVVPAFNGTATETGGKSGKDISGNTVNVSAGTYVEFCLQDNDAYNANVLTLVDKTLENVLRFGVLQEYYNIVPQPDFLKLCTARFMAELLKLEKRLFQLKKKSVVILP